MSNQKLEILQKQEIEILELSAFPQQCIYCNSLNFKNQGKRKNATRVTQRYICNNCSKTFSYNLGFEKLNLDSIYVTEALQLYFTGVSLKDISRFFEMHGITISLQAIYQWIKKYTRLINTHLNEFVPQVGDTWRCDEIYLKIKGKQRYLFAMMDNDSRFIISYFVGEKKQVGFARTLFRMAKMRTQKNPKTIITDGLHSYKVAYRKEFWTQKSPRVKHIYATFEAKNKAINNRMERWNGYFREREKTMRGIKKEDSVVIDGIVLYYNFIRTHSSLKMTPAEFIGFNIHGKNKWMTLIQNASLAQKTFSGEIK